MIFRENTDHSNKDVIGDEKKLVIKLVIINN